MLIPEADVKKKIGRNILMDLLNKNIRHRKSYAVGLKKVKCNLYRYLNIVACPLQAGIV
jgi:hypothetical protein